VKIDFFLTVKNKGLKEYKITTNPLFFVLLAIVYPPISLGIK
jgi:hypothetical protein